MDSSKHLSPAQAYWQQRFVLADGRDRILALHKVVNSPIDMSPFQLAQLMAFALEFAPDIILELGRGYGNSTCAFTEVANRLKPHNCQVLSLCNTDYWKWETVPKLRKIVPESWFEPLHALHVDILKFDYQPALANRHKVLVFWDAHGYEVAECVLGQILPIIASRPHVVIMHDLSDARYLSSSANHYGEHSLWKGGGENVRLRLGHIDSAVEQAVAITDFASRNGLPLHSADHSLHTELGDDPTRMSELQKALGNQLFSLEAHWFWFSLNEIPGPYTFPRFNANGAIKRLNPTALLKLIRNYPALCSYLTDHPDLAGDLEFIKKEFGRLSLKAKISLISYMIWKALRGSYHLRESPTTETLAHAE